MNLRQSSRRLLDNFNYVFQPRRKPGLILRIGSAYMKHFAHRDKMKRPLRNVDISLNYNCNLSCEHCSCELLKKDDRRLSNGEYSRVAREFMDLGVFYFSFTGGEPLINRNLEEIIQLFQPSNNLIGLQTNAMLLDERRLSSLYEAGVDVLQVSLDSSDPDVHDSFRRKKGAFSETIKKIDLALSMNIRIIVSVTLTHQSISSKGVYDLLSYTGRRNMPVVISVPCPVGKWSGDFSNLLDDDDRQKILRLQTVFSHVRRDFDSNYFRRGCSAGTEKLYLTPYGDIIPCPFIHISFGNVKSESVSEIWKRMLKLKRFTEYSKVCLAGEDADFIKKYIIPTYQAKRLPQNWTEHPSLGSELNIN